MSAKPSIQIALLDFTLFPEHWISMSLSDAREKDEYIRDAFNTILQLNQEDNIRL